MHNPVLKQKQAERDKTVGKFRKTNEVVKLKDLKPAEKNVRMHTQYQLEELFRSVTMFGQIRPIVIDENDTIICGNGLAAAMLQNGVEEAEVLRMIGMSEDEKKKLMIADNRTQTLGLDDSEAIMEILAELDDYEVPGYDADFLESMLAEAESEYIDNKAVHGFGVLTEEQKENIENSEERLDEKREVLGDRPELYQPAPVTAEQLAEEENKFFGTQTMEQGVVRRTIQCPHCGKGIEL